MEIITNQGEKYINEVNRYIEKEKKTKISDMLSTIVMILFFCFYLSVCVLLFQKIAGINTKITYRIMEIIFFLSVVSYTIITLLGHIDKPSPSSLIWNIYIKMEDKGFKPSDMFIWYDSDKIWGNIIFTSDSGEKVSVTESLNGFDIRQKDIKSPVINIDDLTVILPLEQEIPYTSNSG